MFSTMKSILSGILLLEFLAVLIVVHYFLLHMPLTYLPSIVIVDTIFHHLHLQEPLLA